MKQNIASGETAAIPVFLDLEYGGDKFKEESKENYIKQSSSYRGLKEQELKWILWCAL